LEQVVTDKSSRLPVEPAAGAHVREAALLRLGFQSGNDAVAVPKLNYKFADKVLHLSDCFGIVRANQRRLSDMAVTPYKVRPILRHGQSM
jgi:hypothetical protein